MRLTDFLPHMVVFARVVEAKSFSAAALRLNSSKSAVSKQIARLEAALGACLLERTTRRIGLTEAGAVFYEHCLRAIAEAEAAEHVVDKLYEAPRGLLRVASPTAFGHLHLALNRPAVAPLGESLPNSEIFRRLAGAMGYTEA